MDNLSDTVFYIILSVVGAFGSLVVYGWKKFMDTTQAQLSEHDKRMDKIEVRVGEMMARHNEQIISVNATLSRIEKWMEKIDTKFEVQEKNTAEFYRRNPDIK